MSVLAVSARCPSYMVAGSIHDARDIFAVPDLAAQEPTENQWCCIDIAPTASTAHLAEVVLAEGGLPLTTTLLSADREWLGDNSQRC